MKHIKVYYIHLFNELQKRLPIHLDTYMTVLLEYIGDCSITVNQSLNGSHSLFNSFLSEFNTLLYYFVILEEPS